MKKCMALPDLGTISLFLAAVLLLLPIPASAAFGFRLDGSLDKNSISKAYFEGDFHRILPPLEAWRNSRVAKTREDSIFVYKYLSVIYAADSTTRNKAESYMVQLLKLMPTIELVDMYISDNIEAIFKDVQDKFLKQQQYVRHHDDLGRPLTDSTVTKDPKQPASFEPKHNYQWVWWTIGGAGLAATVAGGYFILHQDHPSPAVKTAEP